MFIETPRFPDDLSYGSRGGPRYSTTVVSMFSGHEQRNANWAEARRTYDAAYAVKSDAQLRALINYFHAAQGKANGFRFRDPLDFNNVNVFYADNWMYLGQGDNVNVNYQIRKYYYAGTAQTPERIRDIRKPISGTFQLGRGGSNAPGGGPTVTNYTEGVDYTIDYTTGIITWAAIPGIVAQWWKGEFDVPVRFDTDELVTTIEAYEANTTSVPLVELRT